MQQNDKKIETEISSNPVFGQPETAIDLINKYGTYNIQPTSESENEFPMIAQGYTEKSLKTEQKRKRKK